MPTTIAEQVRQLAEAFDQFVDDTAVDGGIERVDDPGHADVPHEPPSSRYDVADAPARPRFVLIAAAVLLIAGTVTGLVWAGRGGPAPSISTQPATTRPPEQGEVAGPAGLFVWPEPARRYATVGELVTAFATEELHWDAFDIDGIVNDQPAPQSFSIRNATLDAGVAVIALPSADGWGFGQIGSGLSAGVDNASVVRLDFTMTAGTTSNTAVVHLADGSRVEATSTTAHIEIPGIRLEQLGSALVIGRDATGQVVMAVGGRFGPWVPGPGTVTPTMDERPRTPTSHAPPADAPTVEARPGSALADALRPRTRVLVVNASGIAGLGGSLGAALSESGYNVLDPESTADGTLLDESVMYTRADAPLSVPNAIESAVHLARLEIVPGQTPPALTAAMLGRADAIIVLGKDLADAPWQDVLPPLIKPGIGRLLVVDATTTDQGRQHVETQAQHLRDAGVDVAGVVAAATPTEQTMLMPVTSPTPWTYAVADLAGIGGFDTWTPTLVTAALPDGVTAVLLIADT